MKSIPIITIIISVMLLSACSGSPALPLEDEPIATFEVTQTQLSDPTAEPDDDSTVDQTEPSIVEPLSLDSKFASIEFYQVNGVFTRVLSQDELEITELFSLDKDTFIRVAVNDIDREIFSYNYSSEVFTYLYYLDGELLSKTVINLNTGEVLQDEDQFAQLLITDAEDLRTYFYELLEQSGILIEEI